jgi:hypothetical protein
MTPAGQVICWGDNTMEQTTTPPDTFTQISAGTWHTCGVTTRGQVVCWGSDEYAQTAAPAGTFTQVSAGIWHTCALQPDGLPVCWGDNEFGQATPPPTPLTQLRAGGRHTCGLQATGQAVCWGGNTYGQATPPTTAFAQLSAGGRHTCGKQADGQVVCWGLDDYGQATPPTEAFTTVQAGSRYTCGLTAGNQVICWGDVRWVRDTCVAESASPRDIGSAPRCFEETGYCIDGRIREYWEQNGGLPVFGFPISAQRTFTIEGQSIEAQWFERNRLELHPENEPPYDVLLGRLGVDVLEQQGRDWQAFPTADAPQPGCRYFAETQQNVCGDILTAWRANGLELGDLGISERESLALFGLPISPLQEEDIEGQTYQVQWFERARFELHPENAPPFDVLLGLLGREANP